MHDVFVAIAGFWHSIFGFIQDPLSGFWADLIGVRGLGNILSFFENVFGRGATPLG